MTQTALSKALGISQGAVSMIETGETESLSGEVLAGLCRHLTTTPDFVLFGAGTAEDFESAMQIAEMTSIMHRLPPQAREALLSEARLVARATIPGGTEGDPFGVAIPRGPGDRRVRDEPVKIDRRKH